MSDKPQCSHPDRCVGHQYTAPVGHPMTAQKCALTPEMRKQERRRARRIVARHWLDCQFARIGYRPTMRLLHRMNLCWVQPSPMREGDNGQWTPVWCHWCGVRGKRLDVTRVVMPPQTSASVDAPPTHRPVGTSAPYPPSGDA
jgi:hypothetical protein